MSKEPQARLTPGGWTMLGMAAASLLYAVYRLILHIT